MKTNDNFDKLSSDYLFVETAKRVEKFKMNYGNERKLISLGIGDVTLPICSAASKAMARAALELKHRDTFKGYGPDKGYEFLRLKITQEYAFRNIAVDIDEIFVNDGIKSSLAGISELFDKANTVLISDPTYPVYKDTNIISGRRIIYANAFPENGFLPMPDQNIHADIIYICSPNNPTGTVYDRAGLGCWVRYALENEALILFDAAYEAFIDSDKYPEYPHSIYEIDDADNCAVEFRSFSKDAGFTGVRCGYTVVPKRLKSGDKSIYSIWERLNSLKSNGVSYITQRGAEAVFGEEGKAQVRSNVSYYKKNAAMLAQALRVLKIKYTGGINSPYIWLECPDSMSGYEYFDYLLMKFGIIGTPGEGFGKNGRGRLRLSAFGSAEDISEATKRMIE